MNPLFDCLYGTDVGSFTRWSLRYYCWFLYWTFSSVLLVDPFTELSLRFWYWPLYPTVSSILVLILYWTVSSLLGPILDCLFGTGSGSFTRRSRRYWYWILCWTVSSILVVVPLLDYLFCTATGLYTGPFCGTGTGFYTGLFPRY